MPEVDHNLRAAISRSTRIEADENQSFGPRRIDPKSVYYTHNRFGRAG